MIVVTTARSRPSRTGFPLDLLTFEVVESEAISEVAHLRSIIAEYRRHGFRIALDDFGTGYSSLYNIRKFALDALKIDRSFIDGMGREREIDMLQELTKQVEGHTICALGDAAAWPIQGLIRHYRGEIERRIDQYAANPHPDAPALMAAE